MNTVLIVNATIGFSKNPFQVRILLKKGNGYIKELYELLVRREL